MTIQAVFTTKVRSGPKNALTTLDMRVESQMGGPFLHTTKGQLISKMNCQAMDSSKKRTNEFVFTSMRRVCVRFLEESWGLTICFRNYLTFT